MVGRLVVPVVWLYWISLWILQKVTNFFIFGPKVAVVVGANLCLRNTLTAELSSAPNRLSLIPTFILTMSSSSKSSNVWLLLEAPCVELDWRFCVPVKRDKWKRVSFLRDRLRSEHWGWCEGANEVGWRCCG